MSFKTWLLQDRATSPESISDFELLKNNLKFCDVLLVAGQSRLSKLIKLFTNSPWSHAALYIGDITKINDPHLQQLISKHLKETDRSHQHYIIEGVLSRGFVVTPLEFYRNNHLCICRPDKITTAQAQAVIEFALRKLSQKSTICSSVIAKAFDSVNYGSKKRYSYLFSPGDFCHLTDFKVTLSPKIVSNVSHQPTQTTL